MTAMRNPQEQTVEEVVALARRTADGARFLPAIDATPEQVIAALSTAKAMQRVIREASDMISERAKEWIDEHGEIEFEGTRWYVGPVKKIQPAVPMAELAGAVLAAVGGDLEEFCKTLSSRAFKAGHLRDVLGPEWRRCFREEIEREVKTGKPKRVVKSIPVRGVR